MRRSIAPFTLLLAALLLLLFPLMARAAGPPFARVHRVSITYDERHNYAGRLENAQAAFRMLDAFLATNPFAEKRAFSFLKDALKSSMLPQQGYVMTLYGYGYGACGAPSLLNQLVRTAMFRDSDGAEKPVFEPIVWKFENSPTYKGYGVAIFLDLKGSKSSDYVWRLNPAYDGSPPQVTLTVEEDGPANVTFTLTMVYTDEPPDPAAAATPAAP